MKISILLPYKENYSPEYPGAVSLFVASMVKLSKFKSTTKVYGSTDYKSYLTKNYVNISLNKGLFSKIIIACSTASKLVPPSSITLYPKSAALFNALSIPDISSSVIEENQPAPPWITMEISLDSENKTDEKNKSKKLVSVFLIIGNIVNY